MEQKDSIIFTFKNAMTGEILDFHKMKAVYNITLEAYYTE